MNWGADLGIHVVIYFALVFIFFCCVPVVCFYVRIENRTLAKIIPSRCQRQRQRQRQRQQRQLHFNRNRNDRQNNLELGRQHSRLGDIYFIEPNSQEAARIREQLEKDEKDLPSYDEVMRMCNLTTPTAAAALPTPTMESSSIGIAALPAPPYSETDPNQNVAVAATVATNTTVATVLEPSPSTSRAAQIRT